MGNRVAVTGFGIGVLALLFFLAGIGNPPLYIYDESSYVNGARSLLSGTQDLNPEHPPLAKYFIAGGMKFFGDTPFGWRLAAAIFGALTLVAIFFWTYLLLRDYTLALTAAGLTLFGNFLFVMSRVAMLDVFYFAFVIWGVLAFTAALLLEISLARRRLLLVASGLLFGLGTACKWNAVVTLAAVGLVALVLYIRNSFRLREVGVKSLAGALIFVPVAAYALAYWPLCYRFHRPFTAAELIAMNAFIWRYHVNCPGNPALDVPWYRWFFRASPERGLSYLMGNFVVVWTGLLALVVCAWRFLRSQWMAEGLVTLFYAVNVLQWVVIPQKRLVYYYYYPPAMFLGVAIAIVLSRARSTQVLGIRLSVLLLVAAAVFFLYCYPRMASLQSPYDCMFGCWS
jgi:dolichyl-phosphate-mannose-protein mannosyltransferase